MHSVEKIALFYFDLCAPLLCILYVVFSSFWLFCPLRSFVLSLSPAPPNKPRLPPFVPAVLSVPVCFSRAIPPLLSGLGFGVRGNEQLPRGAAAATTERVLRARSVPPLRHPHRAGAQSHGQGGFNFGACPLSVMSPSDGLLGCGVAWQSRTRSRCRLRTFFVVIEFFPRRVGVQKLEVTQKMCARIHTDIGIDIHKSRAQTYTTLKPNRACLYGHGVPVCFQHSYPPVLAWPVCPRTEGACPSC